ncbi:hypothetical protein ELI_1818 [Eubacterium callanderi]|uniref:Uncharacterized protein n=1 Tax=Eubacterium callanderi TaxID=53442 RepID=E3GK49_9FIRM|nr:hypothetical protein ELI_1818 [Eubacterium callanderi]
MPPVNWYCNLTQFSYSALAQKIEISFLLYYYVIGYFIAFFNQFLRMLHIHNTQNKKRERTKK